MTRTNLRTPVIGILFSLALLFAFQGTAAANVSRIAGGSGVTAVFYSGLGGIVVKPTVCTDTAYLKSNQTLASEVRFFSDVRGNWGTEVAKFSGDLVNTQIALPYGGGYTTQPCITWRFGGDVGYTFHGTLWIVVNYWWYTPSGWQPVVEVIGRYTL